MLSHHQMRGWCILTVLFAAALAAAAVATRPFACGYNVDGETGIGVTVPVSLLLPISGLSNVTALSGGGMHAMALTASGTVWTWGNNGIGPLLCGTYNQTIVPLQVPNLTGVTAVSAGYDWCLALLADGSVCAWGANNFGQLGDGKISQQEETPTAVIDLPAISALSAGGLHNLALTTTGGVMAWGSNSSGQLGDGTNTDRSTAVSVSPLTSGVTAVSAGNAHSLALQNGTVWAWGDNTFGQLGNNTNNSSTTPVQVMIDGTTPLTNIIAIAAGGTHSLALQNDGTVWVWGYNNDGQLGDGTNTNENHAEKLTSISGATAIAAGFSHSLALGADGSAWVWGSNQYGQLGDGTTTSQNIPERIGHFLAKAISAGGASNDTFVRKIQLPTIPVASGDNMFGQLGDGTTTNRALPVAVSGLSTSTVTALSNGILHSVALTADGSVWVWGSNASGELGGATTAGQSAVPLQVPGLSGIIAVAAGKQHSLALKSDGTVWAWGDNSYGQLGIGSTSVPATPVVQVSGLPFIIAIAVGSYHNLALDSSGSVWTWGYNGTGQLGNGSTIQQTTPVQPAIFFRRGQRDSRG